MIEIETYDDHRVAMCFSLAACAGVPGAYHPMIVIALFSCR